MVNRSSEFPSYGELVVGTVTEINPNSIFVRLDEYDKEGMVHISEVAKKWVRDIRNWANMGQKVVCKVKGVREEKNQIDLSLKDVSDRAKNRRMQQWKRDERGEEFLNVLAEKSGNSLDEIYEKIGFDLQDNFKDMLEPFEIAVKKGVEELKRRDVDKKWAELLKEVGEEKIKIKEATVKKRFSIRSLKSDGIDVLKSSLGDIEEEFGVEIRYISAPDYEISKVSKDPRAAEETIKSALGKLREINKDGEVEIKSPFE